MPTAEQVRAALIRIDAILRGDHAGWDASLSAIRNDLRAALEATEEVSGWQPADTAKYGINHLVWVHLPKNPPASACSIGSRVYVQDQNRDGHGDEGFGVREHDSWWVFGRYYPPGYVTHWMPLPSPPASKDEADE